MVLYFELNALINQRLYLFFALIQKSDNKNEEANFFLILVSI